MQTIPFTLSLYSYTLMSPKATLLITRKDFIGDLKVMELLMVREVHSEINKDKFPNVMPTSLLLLITEKSQVAHICSH